MLLSGQGEQQQDIGLLLGEGGVTLIGDSRQNYPASGLHACSVRRGEMLPIKRTGGTDERELRSKLGAAIVRVPALFERV